MRVTRVSTLHPRSTNNPTALAIQEAGGVDKVGFVLSLGTGAWSPIPVRRSFVSLPALC